MARSNPDAALVREIDDLNAKLEARLEQLVDEDRELLRASSPDSQPLPRGVHRNLLLRHGSNLFLEMRRLLTAREAR